MTTPSSARTSRTSASAETQPSTCGPTRIPASSSPTTAGWWADSNSSPATFAVANSTNRSTRTDPLSIRKEHRPPTRLPGTPWRYLSPFPRALLSLAGGTHGGIIFLRFRVLRSTAVLEKASPTREGERHPLLPSRPQFPLHTHSTASDV